MFLFVLFVWKKIFKFFFPHRLGRPSSCQATAEPSAPVPELPPESVARTTAPPPWSPWTPPPPPLPLLHASSSPPYISGAPGPVSPLCRAAPLLPHLAAACTASRRRRRSQLLRRRPLLLPAPHSAPPLALLRCCRRRAALTGAPRHLAGVNRRRRREPLPNR